MPSLNPVGSSPIACANSDSVATLHIGAFHIPLWSMLSPRRLERAKTRSIAPAAVGRRNRFARSRRQFSSPAPDAPSHTPAASRSPASGPLTGCDENSHLAPSPPSLSCAGQQPAWGKIMSIHLWWARIRSSHPVWYGDEDSAVLVNLRTGRVFGRWHHDGYGSWDVDVCLPYWRASSVIRSSPAWFAAFAGFPFCWVSLFRAKNQEGAEDAIYEFVGPVLIQRDLPQELEDPAEPE